MLNYNILSLSELLNEGPHEGEVKMLEHSIHRPDHVNMKACRWFWVCACACVSTFGCEWAGGMSRRRWRSRERECSTTHAYCTARVYLCVFAQWGFLSADLSEFCCVSSRVGNMNIHEVLLSLLKALCCSLGGRKVGYRGQRGCRVCVHCWGELLFHYSFTFWHLGESPGGHVTQDCAGALSVLLFLSAKIS